jgi:hypothetical protein
VLEQDREEWSLRNMRGLGVFYVEKEKEMEKVSHGFGI